MAEMFWTEKKGAKQGGERSKTKRKITKDFANSIEHIVLDAMQLVHCVFSFLKVNSGLSKSFVVHEITSRLLIMAKNLLDACKNCCCVTFVFDGPPSTLKTEEIEQRYEKSHAARERGEECLQIFETTLDEGERENARAIIGYQILLGIISIRIRATKRFQLEIIRETNRREMPTSQTNIFTL
jgi:hypothetical protein